MLTYAEALDYLYSFVDYSAVRADRYSPEAFDLARVAGLLRALGDPQDRYPVLHIAGTKGKGSVAAMCASALRAGGYHTGLYTSPHLFDFCERVQIDGQSIAQAAVAEIVTQLKALAPAHPGITTFELTTALAFCHFARQKVDAAVIEVGLGGRLDATNVVHPLVSVITALSYDHTALLGNTLAEIAAEKGGIIKPGVPLVSAPQPAEALAVLEQICQERSARLSVIGRDWHFRPVAHDLDRQTLEVWSQAEQQQLAALPAAGHSVTWRPERLEIPLLGEHQVENAAVAYAALAQLRAAGLPLAAAAVRAGLRTVRWPGRFEIVTRRPYVVIDGAHNADSARRLAAALADYFPGRRVCLAFGASADKDVAGMLAALLGPGSPAKRVLLTQAVHPRAMEPEALARLAEPYGIPVEQVSAVQPAMARALAWAGPEDVILACGSLFVVSEARAAVEALAPATAAPLSA
jgi:dihydrofolate synthase/folylpolyglutamate synthase